MTERILIVEDEEVVRTNIQAFLTPRGYEVDAAENGDVALDRIRESEYALVIADIRMPGMDGIELLKRIVAERPETFVIIVTAYASVETAVESLRLGAYDYILKPIVFEDLLQRIQNLFAYRALKDEVLRLRRDLSDRLGFEGLVGESPPIRAVFDLIGKVAPTDATVLLVGESGTGKELVARAIHARSQRADSEFLSINVAAIPQPLVESQLFGNEAGAGEGAERRREGLLRSVRGGTVFLDEVSQIPIHAQAKLLRALEDGEILPLGAERPLPAEFRLVAATNRELDAAVEGGAFRSDLHLQLNAFRIDVPPLRERRGDIAALVAHFLKLHSRAQGRPPPSVANETMKTLLGYPWPGNVRELSNVVERACILCDGGQILPEHLPAELLTADTLPVRLRSAVEEFERRHIAWVLRAAGGNRERAAQMLEIDPATLYRRLAKYDLREP